MGTIDDVRKVIQDPVAPELKSLHIEVQRVDETSKLRDEALSAKIDALSDKTDVEFEKMDIKLEALSNKMDLKFDLVMAKMEANQAALLYTVGIDKRLEAIERKAADPMQAT